MQTHIIHSLLKRALGLLCLCVWPLCGLAQQLTVQAPRSVAAGQTFQVTFSIDASHQKFQAPSFQGFTVLGGPNRSQSSSTTFINGKRTTSSSYSYSFYVRAEQEGTVTIGPASCVVEGKTISSEPATLTVTKNTGGGGNSGARQQAGNASQQATTIDEHSLFARASVNKSEVYQGEQVIVTYKLYTQVSLQHFQLDKLPGNKGFWSEDLSSNRDVRTYDETLNGRQYRVAEVRRGALFAQQSGKLRLEPYDITVQAVVPRARQRTGTIFDLFDDPFFNMGQAVERQLRTNAVTLNVRPLPPAPDNFTGGVGTFKIETSTDLREVRANEAITYRLTISGSGNLMLCEAPKMDFPASFEVYDPKVIDDIHRGDNGISGKRTFEWVLIPRSQGDYTLSPATFVYFNPASGKYETLRGNAFDIKVAKGDPRAMTGGSLSAQSDVKLLNSDINHIHPSAHLRRASQRGRIGVGLWLLLALPVVAGVAVVVLTRKRRTLQADSGEMKLRRATKLARKRLREAERLMNGTDDERFYEAIYRALWGCLSDKYRIDLSQLSRETVSDKLREKGVSDELYGRIMRTLDDVDMARFAPGESATKKQNVFQEALDTIMAL